MNEDVRILSRGNGHINPMHNDGSTVWKNDELVDKINLYHKKSFEEAIHIVSKMGFVKFPSIILFKQEIEDGFHTIVPRIDWSNNDDSKVIINRYKTDIKEYEDEHKPLISVMFRPVTVLDWCGMLVLGDTDGLVNVGYREYGKVWKHIPNKPLTLENFKED